MKRSLIFIVTLVLSFNCFALYMPGDDKCGSVCRSLESLGTWEEQCARANKVAGSNPSVASRDIVIDGKLYTCTLFSNGDIECYK